MKRKLSGRHIFFSFFELSFWIMALVLLAFMDPEADSHYSFCIFKMTGITFCPGCGLGHSISYLFHGELRQSIHAHPFGILAVPVIVYRVFQLTRLRLFPKTINY
ncbi:MAG: DUF2752 domain-containing protein [Ginsengibacter sp.]